ncbi:unnamed protein product [Cunninghamella blakesleeana]
MKLSIKVDSSTIDSVKIRTALNQLINSRADRIIYVLSQIVINDYKQDVLQVKLDAKNIYLSSDEKDRKETADTIYMVTEKNGVSNINAIVKKTSSVLFFE